MWRRLRRRTMAPRRPVLYRDQIGLAIIVAALFAISIYALVRMLTL